MSASQVSALALFVVIAMSTFAVADEPTFDAQAEEQAAKSIRGFASNIQKNRDGSVRFVRFSKPLVTNDHVLATAAFSRLDFLAVISPQVTDDGFASLEKLQNLDTLCLSGLRITDQTAGVAAKLPKLERLYLDGTKITDSAVISLTGRSTLKVLDLDRTAVTDGSGAALATLTSLQTLSLRSTQISDKSFPHLAKLAELRYLLLAGCELTDLEPLAAFPKLEVLDLSNMKLTPAMLGPLLGGKSLKRVIVRNTGLVAKDLAELNRNERSIEFSFSPAEERSRDALMRYVADQTLRAAPKSSAGAPVDVEAQLASAAKRFAVEGSTEVPDFQRHVVPLFGRLGCNGRTCHGSFQGQGGFRLSMFGYDFAADWKAIHGDEYSRVDVQTPDESLLIQKPSEMEPHEGGQRFKPNSWEHRLLRRWIAGGAKARPSDAAELVQFRVEPAEILFTDQQQSVQLRCFARWSDGVEEDVTCLTRFQSNSDSVAEVDSDGRVKSLGVGDTHVIAFYDKGVFAIPVLRPFGPARKPLISKSKSPIDRFVNLKLGKLGLEPSDACTDAEFLRRVSLDLIGSLPTPAEVRAFMADKSPDKREKKVDALLQTPAYVEWWTMRLADLTGSNAQSLGSTDMNSPAAGQWVDWLRRRVRDNVGWDRIAAGMILATSRRPGQDYDTYAAEQSRHLARKDRTDFTALENPMHYYWFRSNNQSPSDRALAFSFVFLGVRLECAQCHKHPFDRWSKEDFDQFTQFFTRIKSGIAPDARDAQTHLKTKLGVPKKLDTAALRRQMYMRVAAEGLPIPWNEIWIESPKSKPQTARLLGGESFDLNAFEDPREPLFEWLVRNPTFSKAFVNRIWFHYMGRGLVDPPDDFNQANPASHPLLLDWLAESFVEHGFDMKWLHREIVLSDAYQRSSRAIENNTYDERNYSRSLIRRLPAEVAIDAMLQATANDKQVAAWNENVKQRRIAQHPKSFQARSVDYALLVFGKPLRTTNCDCERQVQPTLLQSIYRRNDKDILERLERPDGWLVEVAKRLKQTLLVESRAAKTTAKPTPSAEPLDEQQVGALIESAYLRTLSRLPTTGERQRARDHFAGGESGMESLRDLMWALLNTREFITNH